jgi:protein-S-isoprenylcysteine O-methyltransferase Ste14
MTLTVRHDIRSSSHLGVTVLLSPQSSVLSPLLSLWRKLVGLHREVEATKWGALVLGNVWPAYLFALPLGARIWNLARARYGDSLHEQASLVQEVVTIVFLALVVVLFAIRRRGIEGQRATLQSGAVALLGTFLLNVVGYLPIEETTATDALLASIVVVVLGTLFTIWSLATLGRNFGLFPEVRGLVLRGPYRLVRHPVYLGELIAALGLLIARPHPLTFAVFGVFVVLQYWRTIFEERALAAAYPDEYAAYRRQVPRLVPGVRP